MQVKEAWAKNSMDQLNHEEEVTLRAGQPQSSREKTPRKWAKRRWKEKWEHYLSTVPEWKRMPAHWEDPGQQRDKLHQRLCKAESSPAIQLRIEKVGFSDTPVAGTGVDQGKFDAEGTYAKHIPHRYVMWRQRQQDRRGKAGQLRIFSKELFSYILLGGTPRLATQLEMA